MCCININGVTQLSLLINDLSEKQEISKEQRSLNREAPNKTALVMVFLVVAPKPIMELVIVVAWIVQKIDNDPGFESVLSPGRPYHASSLDLVSFSLRAFLGILAHCSM